MGGHARDREVGRFVAGALASIDRSEADRPGSPLAERALSLRARILHQAGRVDEARSVAAEYLERFPEGGLAEWMRALRREIPTEAP